MNNRMRLLLSIPNADLMAEAARCKAAAAKVRTLPSKSICMWGYIGLVFLMARVEAGGRVTVTPTVPTRVEEATLFSFDDISIPYTYNLYLSMHAAQKHPDNPVVPLGEDGEPDEWAQTYYGTVIRHEGKFKMWYIGTSREGFESPELGGNRYSGGIDTRGWRALYAESEDGVRWVKPNLGLVEFRGSRDNNIVLMPEGFRGYHIMVLHEPEDPDPTRHFKATVQVTNYGGYTVPQVAAETTFRGPPGAYLTLYSEDGLRWRLAEELIPEGGKTISGGIQLVTRLEGTGLWKWKGMYYLAGQGKGSPAVEPYGRHVEIFRSSDLIHWSRTQTMGFAREGQFRRPRSLKRPLPNEQTHEGVSVWNRGNVLIGITGFWHGGAKWTDVLHPLGFLVSNDGLHFREPLPEFIFAEVGEDGRDWDYGGLSQGQGFENVGDKTYIWYGQMDQRMGIRAGTPWKRHRGIGLLLLDRDRFGSLSVRDPDEVGILLTSDLQLEGAAQLWVNAEGLGPRSSLKVELLDRLERPLPAFSGVNSAVVEKSGLRTPIHWRSAHPLRNLGDPFKIRVTLQGDESGAIRLYALYLGPPQE